MGKGIIGNIILTGFSYTGKTKVGQDVAKRLGWRFVDTDEEIIHQSGEPIAQIFARDGESRFREIEREILDEVCSRENTVISTGGGAFISEENRGLMLGSGVVICLEARPDTIYKRLLKDAEGNPDLEVRPLLTVTNPLERIEELKGIRQCYYALSDWTVHTDSLSIGEAAEEVIRGWRYCSSQKKGEGSIPSIAESGKSGIEHLDQQETIHVLTTTASYPVYIGWDFLSTLGRRMTNEGLQGRAYIISDNKVAPLYAESIRQVLESDGFAVVSFVVPYGERSKSFETAINIYDWLVEHRAERGDNIVALGGGVIGDLAGFVASTYLRGLPLVQVPTSLVGMVDAAIGGKVAINHPEGKNLIGAFYHPKLVFTDIETLTTLPRRELLSGWAEVIKHAMIRDPHLLNLMEEKTKQLLGLNKGTMTDIVSRSANIKAKVVGEDEKERGMRAILNYGHTIAHGIEAATCYGRFLHGEAVSIGMTGAAILSRRLGLLTEEVVGRQKAILRSFNLPTSCTDVDIRSVLHAMELDKKVRGERVRWVLLKDIGQTVIRDDVPRELVESVVKELMTD